MTDTPRTARVAGAALLVAALTVAFAAGVAAQTTGQVPSTPVTDYAGYPGPDDGVPAGCAAGDMAGLTFQRARAGAPPVTGPELNALGVIMQGDTLTMTWAAVTPECVGGQATLVVKRAASASFNIADNQEFVAGVSVTVGGGPGQLTIAVALDPLNGACFVQIDAVYGRPLAVVGPAGSFYNNVTRGDTGPNVLESAYNGALAPCAAQPPTTLSPPTTVPPTTVPPTTAPPVTTAQPPATLPPPTTPPPTTTPPTTATTTAPTTTAPTSGQSATGAADRQTIPTTGATEQGLRLAVLLTAAGALLLCRARALARQETQ